jgi:hypothetical protein
LHLISASPGVEELQKSLAFQYLNFKNPCGVNFFQIRNPGGVPILISEIKGEIQLKLQEKSKLVLGILGSREIKLEFLGVKRKYRGGRRVGEEKYS